MADFYEQIKKQGTDNITSGIKKFNEEQRKKRAENAKKTTPTVQTTKRDTVPSSPVPKASTPAPGTVGWQGGKAYYSDTEIYPQQRRVYTPLDSIEMAASTAADKWAQKTFPQAPELDFTKYEQTSPFGQNNGLKSAHNGIDYGTPMNTPVGAIANGTVIQTGNAGTYGNLVKVRFDDGNIGYYSHLNSFNVKAGDKVRAGDILGTSGNTGRSTGPHLHLEVRGADDNYYNQIDPQKYIDMYNPQPYKAPEPLYYDYKTNTAKTRDQLINKDVVISAPPQNYNKIEKQEIKNPTFGNDAGYVAQSALAGLSSAAGGMVDALVTAPYAREIEKTVGTGNKPDKNSSFTDKLLHYAKNMWEKTADYMIQRSSLGTVYKTIKTGLRTYLSNKYTDQNAKKEGFENAEEMAKADIEKAYGMTDFFDKPANKLAFKQIGVSDGAKFTGELTQTISYMVPSIAVSLLTKNPNIATAMIATSAGGNAAKEAYKNGATAEQAYYNGILKGTAEYLTEKMFGGIPALGKGILGKNADDIISKLSKSSIGKFLNSSYGKVVMELLDRGGEGLEEAITGLASGYIDRLTYDDKAELATAKELGRDFYMGVLVSFIMNAPVDVVKGISNISAKGIKTTTPSEPKTTPAASEQTNLTEDVPVLTEAVSEVPAESPRNTENIKPAQTTFESTTEVEIDTALTPQEAQVYNIITSNLKRRAEESGILTRDVMERLQNVNAYNPSVSDIKAINNEMHSMFDGTEDAEINGYLNSFDRTLEKAEARKNTQTTENAEADLTPSLPLNTENSTSMTKTTEDSSEIETPSNASETTYKPEKDISPKTTPSESDNISKLMRGEKVDIKDMSAEEIATLEKEYGFKIKKQKQLDNIAERKALELRLKEGEKKLEEEIFGKDTKTIEDKSEDALFSIKHIVGKNKDYGNGVLLDTDLFDKVKPRNWNKKLADFVYNKLAGQSLTIYDENGNSQKIEFAKAKERVKKDGTAKDHLVINKLARIKGNINTLSVVHIDELLETSQKFDENNENSHQWMDEKGWEHRKAYLEDINGNIYETTLNIARARDGRNILYALSNTKRVEDGTVSSTSNEEGLAHNNNSLKKSITHSDKVVKEADRKKVENIAKVLNREVEWYNDETALDDMERNSNGVFIPGDVGKKPKIRINENAENPYTVVLGHECFHSLDEKTKKGIIDFIYKNTDTKNEKYQNWKKSIKDAYKANNKTLSEKTLKEEFAAENMERFFDSDEFLNRLKTEDKSLYEKIKQWVKNLFVRFKNKGIFDLNAAAKASDLTDRQLRKLARMFEVGLKPSPSLRDTSPKVRGLERKYDIKTDKNGKKYWHIESDKDIFKNITNRKELQKAAFQYILKGYKGEDVHTEIDGKKINFTRISAEEYLYGTASKSLNKEAYDKKLRMAPSIMDLIENASVKYPTPDHKNHKFAKDGFDNYRGRVRIDDVMFSYIVRIGKNQEKAMFYDINLEVESVILPSVKTRQKYKMDTTSNDIVSQDDSAVNTNSMQNKEMYSVKRAESAVVEEDLFDDAGVVEEKTADVLLRMPEPPKENLKSRIEAVVDFAIRKISDSGNAFNRIGKLMNDDLLYAYYDLAKRGKTSAMYCIEKAQKDINGKTVGKGLLEIFAPVEEKGDEYHKEFSEYLFHKHNVDRMKYDKPVFGWKVTSEMSEEKANELLMKHPEFLGLAEEVYKYVDNELKYAADSGLVSQNYYNYIKNKYPHYVPTYRDYEAPKGKGKKGKLSDFMVTAEGGTENLLPILQTLEQKTIKGRNQGQINVLLNRVLSHAVSNKEKMSAFVTRITDLEAGKNDINAFTFYRNGKAVTMHVSDSLNEGIKSLVQDYKEANLIADGITKLNNAYKASITSWSPMFTLKNFARDIQDTVFYSKDSVAFAKAYPRAWKEMTTGGEMWELYCYLGGFDSGILDAKTGLPIKPKGLGKISDRIQYINYIVEQSPRFAEFLATVENGGTSRDNLAQAMLNSANVTVNFNRSGTVTKTLNRTFVPFLNPSIQGMSNNIRALRESKNFKAWGGLVIKAALFGVAPAILNNLMYDDDEEYENLYQRDKDTNYLFKMPNKNFLKIPKGRLLSAMGATTNFVTNMAEGKDVAVNEYLSLMYDNLGPVNPLTSNIAAPILLAKMNRTWYDGEIESQRMEGLFAEEKYDSSTSAIAKGIGKALKISPMKIDYVLDAYSGVFGDFILPWTSDKGVSNPAEAFKRAFVIDPVYSNKISSDYYSKKDYWTNMKNSVRNDKRPVAAVVSRYLNSCSEAISNLNNQIRETEASKIDDKFDKLKETRVIKNATLKTMTLQLPDVVKSAHKLYSEADLKQYIAKYGKDGEQKYIDYLYREMNKKTFGAEYALQIYNKDTYKKAQKVYKEGVSYDSFYNCYFGFKELGEDATNDDKRAWLMDSKEFSSGEKAILDKNLISRYSMIYNDRSVDYSNEESFILTQMSDAAQRKKSRFPNMSAERYNKLYEAYSSGQKKADKIKNLVEAGMTYTAAEQFYKTISKK